MTMRVSGAVTAVANVEAHQAMAALASRTGGRAYYNRNDLDTGIRRALDDTKYAYELAYYPDHDSWNGDWHKIRVKVNRPGVTVLAREGYFAFPGPKLLPPKASKQLLEEIALSPLEATAIPISVKMTGNAQFVQVKVDLNARPLFGSQLGGGWKSDFECFFFS